MNPPSLLTTIVKSDSLFSREIKDTIIKHEVNTLIDKICPGLIKVGIPRHLSVRNILSLLEQTSDKYWIWTNDSQIMTDYDIDSLTEFTKFLYDIHSQEYIETGNVMYNGEYQCSQATGDVIKIILDATASVDGYPKLYNWETDIS